MRAKVGQRVLKGDVIGEIGATGRVTGPHLDWRMNLGAHRIDPRLLVGPMPDVLAKPFHQEKDRMGWGGTHQEPIKGLPRTPHHPQSPSPDVRQPDA